MAGEFWHPDEDWKHPPRGRPQADTTERTIQSHDPRDDAPVRALSSCRDSRRQSWTQVLEAAADRASGGAASAAELHRDALQLSLDVVAAPLSEFQKMAEP